MPPEINRKSGFGKEERNGDLHDALGLRFAQEAFDDMVIPMEDIDVESPKSLKDESGEGRTEVNLAKTLVSQCGDILRYVLEWGEWIVWDGMRWEKDHNEVIAQAKAIQVPNSIWRYLSEHKLADWQRKHIANYAKAASSAKGIANMVKIARGMLTIEATHLDLDPWLLNTGNGTLDLKTGKLRAAMQKDYITKLCPTEYHPKAPCSTWLRFLDDIFKHNQGLIRYMQRFLGYALTGEVGEQMLAVLWGEGSNGKGTMMKTVLDVMGGDYAGTPAKSIFMVTQTERHHTDLMDLKGKRLMFAVETEGGGRLNEALIKQLTGGDKITANKKFHDNCTFDPTHKLALATNHKPEIRGRDYAIWRRLKLIPFEVIFKGDQADKDMPKKLMAEAPGILAWMVKGCLDWQKYGLQEPEEVRMAVESYKEEQDKVGEFIRVRCQEAPSLRETAKRLWEAFRAENPDAMSQNTFGRELTRRGFPSEAPGGIAYKIGLKLHED